MEAKKKAKELVDTYWKVLPAFVIGTGDVEYRYAKQCALICVKEILKEINKYSHESLADIQYWQEVEYEIEKL